MILLFSLLNFAFAREIIVQINSNTYQITNATFYETSSQASHSETGFRQHPFYQKYLRSIQAVTPELITEVKPSPKEKSKRENFDACIEDNLRMRFNSKKTGKSIPYYSLQASAMACHSRQFPHYNLIKTSNENDEEVIYASGGKYSKLIEDALLGAIDQALLKKIEKDLGPAPFGKNSCLFFSPNVDKCYLNVNPCESTRLLDKDGLGECAAKLCESLGKFDHINATARLSRSPNAKKSIDRFSLPPQETDRFLQILKSTEKNSPICLKCPPNTEANPYREDCIDKHGCSLLKGEVFDKDYSQCLPEKCIGKIGKDRPIECPHSSCKIKCENNIKILKKALQTVSEISPENLASEWSSAEINLYEESSPQDFAPLSYAQIDGALFRLPEENQPLVWNKIILLLKSQISQYENEKASCSESKANVCYGADSKLAEMLVDLTKNTCPKGEVYIPYEMADIKCVKNQCEICIQRIYETMSSSGVHLFQQNSSLFNSCGQDLISGELFFHYQTSLRSAFEYELIKCQESKPFSCADETSGIDPNKFYRYMTSMHYTCHLQGNPSAKSKSVRGDK